MSMVVFYFTTITLRQQEIIRKQKVALTLLQNHDSIDNLKTKVSQEIQNSLDMGHILLKQNTLWLFIVLLFSSFSSYAFIRKKAEDDDMISKEKENAEKLYEEVLQERTVDPMTQLPNRFSLLIDLKDSHISLVDIKSFSSISHSYSTQTSENILVDFFVRVVNAIDYEGVRVFRYDVDIAAITAKNWVYDESDFFAICKEIYSEINFYCIDNIPIRTCMGLSYESNGKQMYGAEIALGFAKKQDGFFVYKTDKVEENMQNYKLHAKKVIDFHLAIKSNNILAFYQPIVDLQSLRLVKYEALVRLRSDDGIMHPNEFLSGVYKFGLGHQITEQIFKNAWKAADEISVSININLSDMESDRIRAKIIRDLSSNPEKAKKITFEILENEGIENNSIIESFIQQIKALGVNIAIDDFGTGYSNFERILSVWKADIVKVDGSLIKNIKDPNIRNVVNGIVKIAKESGLKTVAEFVSDEEIFHAVRECGFDYGQGFYFGKAVPLEYATDTRKRVDGNLPQSA